MYLKAPFLVLFHSLIFAAFEITVQKLYLFSAMLMTSNYIYPLLTVFQDVKNSLTLNCLTLNKNKTEITVFGKRPPLSYLQVGLSTFVLTNLSVVPNCQNTTLNSFRNLETLVHVDVYSPYSTRSFGCIIFTITKASVICWFIIKFYCSSSLNQCLPNCCEELCEKLKFATIFILYTNACVPLNSLHDYVQLHSKCFAKSFITI